MKTNIQQTSTIFTPTEHAELLIRLQGQKKNYKIWYINNKVQGEINEK